MRKKIHYYDFEPRAKKYLYFLFKIPSLICIARDPKQIRFKINLRNLVKRMCSRRMCAFFSGDSFKTLRKVYRTVKSARFFFFLFYLFLFILFEIVCFCCVARFVSAFIALIFGVGL